MLPESLQSSYQQYKHDSNNIAKWLAKTARKCGYPADLLTDPNPVQDRTGTKALSKPKGKGKKKVTKQAGAAANMTAWELFQAFQKSQPAPASQKKEYVIKVSSFIPLAEFVASKKYCQNLSSFHDHDRSYHCSPEDSTQDGLQDRKVDRSCLPTKATTSSLV